MVCPMATERSKGEAIRPGRVPKKSAWSTAGSEAGATTAKQWRNDLVGGEMLQQRPEATA
jgi:hypothetical protein